MNEEAAELEWTKPKSNDSLNSSENRNPCNRRAHTAVVWKDALFVFGGVNKNSMCEDNGIWIYRFASKAWRKTETGGVTVPARHSHTAVVYYNSMWVFGGVDEAGNELSDVYEFDFERFTWQCVASSKSQAPSGRWGHSCVVNGNSMFIFGGRDREKIKNDLYEFHFNSRSWNRLVTAGDVPPERYYHKAVLHQENLYVLGGKNSEGTLGDMYSLDFDTKTWREHKMTDTTPTKRYGHTMEVYKDICLVFGGVHATETDLQTIYTYHFDTGEWDSVQGQPNPALSRHLHSSTFYKDSIYIFAGSAGKKCWSDLNVLRIGPISPYTNAGLNRVNSLPDARLTTSQIGRDLNNNHIVHSQAISTSPTAPRSYTMSNRVNSLPDTRIATSQLRERNSNHTHFQNLSTSTPNKITEIVNNKKIRLKCSYDNELRVISIWPSVTLSELGKQLREEYQIDPVAPLNLQYKDNEGDLINIRSDEGLHEAFQSFLESNNNNTVVNTFRLEIKLLNKTADGSDALSRRMSIGTSSAIKQLGITDNKGLRVHVPEQWRLGTMIGKGAFGTVYLALNLKTGEIIAVKKIQLDPELADYEKKIQALEKEIDILSNLNHPNIVRYLGSEIDEKNHLMNIIIEYVPGGSLQSMISKFGELSETLVKRFTKQILIGLKYLHDKGFIHRDIKGANILVDQYGRVKLSDFGAATKIASVTSVVTASVRMGASNCESFTGTAYWMAPEVIKQSSYGRKCDVWSVGCTVIEMLTGVPPWSHLQPVSALFQIASTDELPALPANISLRCADFISKCLSRNVEERPTVQEMLRHPFMPRRVVSIETLVKKDLSKSEDAGTFNAIEEHKVPSEDKEDEYEFTSEDSLEDNRNSHTPKPSSLSSESKSLKHLGKIKSQPVLTSISKREVLITKQRKTLGTSRAGSETDVLHPTKHHIPKIPSYPSVSTSRPRGRSTPEKPNFLPKIGLPRLIYPKRASLAQSSISISSSPSAKSPTNSQSKSSRSLNVTPIKNKVKDTSTPPKSRTKETKERREKKKKEKI